MMGWAGCQGHEASKGERKFFYQEAPLIVRAELRGFQIFQLTWTTFRINIHK